MKLYISGTNIAIDFETRDTVLEIRKRIAKASKVDVKCVEIYDQFAFMGVKAGDTVTGGMLYKPFVFIRCIECNTHK